MGLILDEFGRVSVELRRESLCVCIGLDETAEVEFEIDYTDVHDLHRALSAVLKEDRYLLDFPRRFRLRKDAPANEARDGQA